MLKGYLYSSLASFVTSNKTFYGKKYFITPPPILYAFKTKKSWCVGYAYAMRGLHTSKNPFENPLISYRCAIRGVYIL